MKKFYSLMVMLFAVLSMQAEESSSFSVTFRVDASNRISYEDPATYATVPFVEGDNVVTFNAIPGVDVYFSMVIADGYGISSVKNLTTGEDMEVQWGSYLTFSSALDGNVIEIKTYNENDSRTGEMSVWVDDASKVAICYPNGKEAAPLVNGDNVLKYNPETERYVIIRESNWGHLYKVLVNGEKAVDEYGSFEVQCSPENKVEIFAIFPDVEVPVSIKFANEGTEEAISSVLVNGMPVDNFKEGFNVKMGVELSLNLNTADYNITSLTKNGEPVDTYNSYTEIVTDDALDFELTAVKYNTIAFKLTVNEPAGVLVYKGEMWNEILFEGLVAGDNDLEISEGDPMISVKANSGGKILSITKNGEAVEEGWGSYGIMIEEGDHIVIDCKAAKRDKLAYVWLNDASVANYYCGLSRADDTAYDDDFGFLETGFNQVLFDDEVDNPFYFFFSGEAFTGANIILDNGEVVIPEIEWSMANVRVSLTDGAVIKVFLNEEPQPCTVRFARVVNDAEVTYDIIKKHEDLSKPLSTYAGTVVGIKTKYSQVYVDGKALEADEDGLCTFTVTGNHIVTMPVPVGINEVSGTTSDAGNVYSIQGALILNNATTEKLNSLPAGVYVKDGKKFVVK